ncbi:hypothetical protein [Prosthecobacter sp.]|uniref:hypothetical protein n=1 Tax=Prosthecobacter sp. TaxID=1965333 RepID=UPI00378481AC
MTTSLKKGDGTFPTTEWTLVARLRNKDAGVSARALDDLCTQYHYPLYCFIRQRGLPHHDAQDALHDFFAKLLRLEAFEDMEQEKGRLRTFLAKSLQRFLITRHQQESRRAERELSVDCTRFALDPKLEQRYQRELAASHHAPDVVFDRQWCEQLLQRVLLRLQADYQKRKKLPVFTTLRPVLLSGGSLRGHDAAQLAATLTMTEPALRTALLRLLRDYRTLLEDEVLQTVTSKDEVEAEIAQLMNSLRRD